MKNLYKKLLAIQKEVKGITKDSENPFFKSKYFDINGLLDELKPILNKHGVVVMQPLTHVNGTLALETIVVDEESGEETKSICLLPENPDPQKMGSAITYFRRYSLQSLFLLQAEDDDGNVASETSPDAQNGDTTNVKAKGGKMASDKQKDLIMSLAIERGYDITKEQLDSLSSWEASQKINKLKATIVPTASKSKDQAMDAVEHDLNAENEELPIIDQDNPLL